MRPARHRRGLAGAAALPPHAVLSSIVRRTSILSLSPSPTATPSSPRQLARSATRRAISSPHRCRASVPSRLKVRSCHGLPTHHTTHCRGWPLVPPYPATLLLTARHRRGLAGAAALPPHAVLSSIVRRTSILSLSPSPTATPSSPRQLARSATRRAISSPHRCRASVPSRLKVRSCHGLPTHHTTHCRGWPLVPPYPATLLLPVVGGTGGFAHFVLHNTHCSFGRLWNQAPPAS